MCAPFLVCTSQSARHFWRQTAMFMHCRAGRHEAALTRGALEPCSSLRQVWELLPTQNLDCDFLQDVRIAFIAAGSAACHCMAGSVTGKLFTWGRNEASLALWSPGSPYRVAQESDHYAFMTDITGLVVAHVPFVTGVLPTERTAGAWRPDSEEHSNCRRGLGKAGDHCR